MRSPRRRFGNEHVQGWRYQLSLFANAVANEACAGAGHVVDQWFAAWSEPDARCETMRPLEASHPGISMRDQFSAIDGLPDLSEHLAAVHRFMPGMRMTREGPVRQCPGYGARRLDRPECRGSGTRPRHQRVHADADGRIDGVTGFWDGSIGARPSRSRALPVVRDPTRALVALDVPAREPANPTRLYRPTLNAISSCAVPDSVLA